MRLKLTDGMKLPPMHRLAHFVRKQPAQGETRAAIVDPDTRTLELTFSSEQPVDRWWGAEILSHDVGAADLTRLNDGAPLLFNHNMDDVIGVVENASIGGDRKGHATVRFAKTARADEIIGMINDDVLRNVSFMYDVDKYIASERDGDGDVDTYTATSWCVYEISIVTVPADQSIGIGRAVTREEKPVRVERISTRQAAAFTSRGKSMPKQHDGGGDPAELDNGDIAVVENLVRQLSPQQLARLRGETEVLRREVDAETQAAARAQALAEARTDETTRVREIEAIAKRMGWDQSRVAELVQQGKSLAEVRGLALEEKLKAPSAAVAGLGPNSVDMTTREKARYSMLRAIQGALSNDWQKAGFEREVSEEIAKSSGRTTGKQNAFYVPTNLPFCPDSDHMRALQALNSKFAQRLMQERAIYQVGTAAQGGNLVETYLLDQQFIEVLRNALVTNALGARYLPGLVGNINIPRQNAATATYWVAESGAPTEAEATFDQVQLRPKTLAALSKMSRLMLLQSTPAIEMLARMDLIAVLALGIDLAALSGSGASGQPTGIVNQSGVGSVVGGTNGANLTFDYLIQLYSAPRIANAPQANLGFAINGKTNGYLRTQKSSTGQYLWFPAGGTIGSAPSDTVMGYPYAISNQLRSNLTKGTSAGICSELIYGNWQELLIGEWGVTEIMVNPYDATGFTTGDMLIRAFQTVDVGVRHAASFAVMSDALTPGF